MNHQDAFSLERKPDIPPKNHNVILSMVSRYSLILFDWDGFTDIVLTKRITGLANARVSSRGMFAFEGKVHTVEILEFGESESILEEADTQWAGTHRALAIERERAKRGSGRRRYGGFLDVWPSDAFEADTVEDTSTCSKKTKQVKRLKTKKKTSSFQTTPKSGQEPQQVLPKPPSDQTNEMRQFPSVEQGSNGRSISVLYEGSAENSGEIGQPRRLPCFTDGLQPDQVDIVEQRVRNHPNHISVGSQTDKVVIIDATETIHHVLDDKDSHSATVKKTLTKMKQRHDEMESKLSSLNSKVDQILAILKSNPVSTGPINLPDCQVIEVEDGRLANYVRNLCNEVSTEAGQSADNLTEVGQSADTEVGQSADTEVGQSADTEAGQSADTEAGQSADTEVGQSADTEAGQSADTEAGQSADKENTNPVSTPNIVSDSSEQQVYVLETPDLPSNTEVLSSATPQTSSNTPQDTVADTVPESNERRSPVRRLSFSDSRKTPLRTVSFNSTARDLVTPINKDLLVLECGSGKTIREINCPEDAVPGNFEFRIAQERIVIAKAGAISQKNFMWRLAQAIYQKEELAGRNCQGRKGKGKLSPRRWHAVVHAYIDTYGRSRSEFVKACEGINSGIRHLK